MVIKQAFIICFINNFIMEKPKLILGFKPENYYQCGFIIHVEAFLIKFYLKNLESCISYRRFGFYFKHHWISATFLFQLYN